ncbi:MAG: hypothetical protein ACRDQA_30565, partial [Nocardioidaceae bacterium]
MSSSFAEPNDFGALDHVVTLPSGESVYNPLRVIPEGDGCEVVFTVPAAPRHERRRLRPRRRSRIGRPCHAQARRRGALTDGKRSGSVTSCGDRPSGHLDAVRRNGWYEAMSSTHEAKPSLKSSS